MATKRTRASMARPPALWVSWQSAEGNKNTEGELQSLNDNGFVVLRVSGTQTLWIPIGRIYSISTKLSDIAEAAVLEDQAAAQASAVINAVASDPTA